MIIPSDNLQRFLFEKLPVRGQLIRLHKSYTAILDRHPYPLTIRKLLGETLAATSLLSAILKFSGSLTLQINSEGPIKLLVAQADYQQHIRGLAIWDGEIDETKLQEMLTNGRLMISIDPGQGMERYQGIVALKGESISSVLENYFASSEQLPTFIYLNASEEHVVGLLLQVMPGTYDKDPAIAWEHLTHLSNTLTAHEMHTLDNETILHRLFHEEDVRLFEPEPVIFYCSCSSERMERAIINMGREDALAFVKQKKVITVTCEFCNRHHDFDAVDVAKIFS